MSWKRLKITYLGEQVNSRMVLWMVLHKYHFSYQGFVNNQMVDKDFTLFKAQSGDACAAAGK